MVEMGYEYKHMCPFICNKAENTIWADGPQIHKEQGISPSACLGETGK